MEPEKGAELVRRPSGSRALSHRGNFNSLVLNLAEEPCRRSGRSNGRLELEKSPWE